MKCPVCNGDGVERCDNPDHGFLVALGVTDIGRIGCPCCGHDEYHRIKGCPCGFCKGLGSIPSLLRSAVAVNYILDMTA